MKMFFDSRSKARTFKSNNINDVSVIDSKAKPSLSGSRWGVEIKIPRRS